MTETKAQALAKAKVEKRAAALQTARNDFEQALVEMRASGATFQAIADAAGMTDGGVFQLLKRAKPARRTVRKTTAKTTAKRPVVKRASTR